MKFESKKYTMIKEALENLSDEELIAIHNEYCSESNNTDNCVYSMDEFNEITDGMENWEIARSCFFGDFRPCDEYFFFNGYGNLESFDFPSQDNAPIYISDIADYIERNNDSLYCDDIAEILEQFEEAEEA